MRNSPLSNLWDINWINRVVKKKIRTLVKSLQLPIARPIASHPMPFKCRIARLFKILYIDLAHDLSGIYPKLISKLLYAFYTSHIESRNEVSPRASCASWQDNERSKESFA